MLVLRRIIRRIRYFPTFLLESYKWEYESCERCGSAFRVIWSVDDKTWAKVMSRDDGGGCVCVDCFVKIAESKGVVIEPKNVKLNLFYPIGL